MNILILGNIVAFIASSFSIILGMIKNREKIIYIQTIQFLIFTVANLILGGITGAIANATGLIRNILCYKEKLTKVAILLIIITSTVFSLGLNNLGFLGLLPLFNTIIYTVFINEKNPLKFKLLFLVTVILWLIYDITIRSYTSALFDSFTIITSAITAYQISKKQKENKQQT